MNTKNFYGGQLYSLEKITLAEDLIFNTFENIVGKFFMEIITPGNDMGAEEIKTVNRGSYQRSNFVTLAIPAGVLFNCVRPSIRPLFIDANGYVNINNGRPIRVFAMEFKEPTSTGYKIPKGTEFLVEFITGSTSLEDYRIMGTSDPYPVVEEITVPPEGGAVKTLGGGATGVSKSKGSTSTTNRAKGVK